LNYFKRRRVSSIGTVQILPPLPFLAYLYAAGQKASFRRGVLRFEKRGPRKGEKRGQSTFLEKGSVEKGSVEKGSEYIFAENVH